MAIVEISGDVKDLPTWKLAGAPELEIKGNAPPYLGSIGEVEFLGDGRLLAEDNQTAELRLFDSDGNVVRLLGGPGAGPGEFRNLTELTVTAGDTISAYDRRLQRISIFDAEGRLVTAVDLIVAERGGGAYVVDAWRLESEYYILERMGPREVDSPTLPRKVYRDVVLSVVDHEVRTKAGPLQFRGGYGVESEYAEGSTPFANERVLGVGAGIVVHGSGMAYELTIRDRDLEPQRIIRWRGWELPLTEDEVRVAREEVEAATSEFRAQQPEIARSLREARFSPDILPDMRPALGGVLLDEGGRLWISRFNPTTARWQQEDSWHVLDPTGRPLARVPLPSNSKLAAVMRDRVAIIVRDSLDVQHLRVFKLIQR